ncbi:MAG: RHS repeat-associated core domain-containing protein [Sphingobacteriales bacterium]|nr:MAG: RHS repeat-associated core domain-containing protein [Sphingobacteriales bacterium]
MFGLPALFREEKHYYPYGLPIQGWGNVATGSLPNRQRYQGNEYREEAGLNWMDFHNRQYDPQLGRFLSLDPLADAGGQQVLSPYHAMACSPVMMVDPFGLRSDVFDNGARPINNTPRVVPLWPMVNPNAALLKMEANALAWSSFMQQHGQELIILNIYNDLLAEYKVTSASNNGVQNASGEVQSNQSNNGYATTITEVGSPGDEDYVIIASAPKKEKKKDWKDEIIPHNIPRKIDDFEGFWGNVKYFWNGGNIDGYQYDSDGNLKGFSPIMGMPPDVGMNRGAISTSIKVSGWIKRSIYKSLDPSIQKKMVSAIEKGIVAPTGSQGIIRLTQTEAVTTGFTHKIKILGKGGDIRIYGNQSENGHIFFEFIKRH